MVAWDERICLPVYVLEKQQSWKYIELSVNSTEKLASCTFFKCLRRAYFKRANLFLSGLMVVGLKAGFLFLFDLGGGSFNLISF